MVMQGWRCHDDVILVIQGWRCRHGDKRMMSPWWCKDDDVILVIQRWQCCHDDMLVTMSSRWYEDNVADWSVVWSVVWRGGEAVRGIHGAVQPATCGQIRSSSSSTRESPSTRQTHLYLTRQLQPSQAFTAGHVSSSQDFVYIVYCVTLKTWGTVITPW